MRRLSTLFVCLIGLGIHQTTDAQKCGSVFNRAQLSKSERASFDQLEKRSKELEQAERSGYSPQFNVTTGEAVILIPVVVHVVYKNATENVSTAQIQSQIDVLNQDYRRRNPDAGNTPSFFANAATDMRIQFYLACVDPDGNATNGITRTLTTESNFTDNNRVKSNTTGGHNAWPANQYLNMWVCDLSPAGFVGYAQFPWQLAGSPTTDGVVVDYQAFGTNGTATFPLNGGRTATHEIGHWLGLIHIWGDEPACNNDDQVSDTPLQADLSPFGAFGTTVNCRTHPFSDACSAAIMFMNYMDYSEDRCMNLFTNGQKFRARATFTGDRSAFQRSNYTMSGDELLCTSSTGTFTVSGTGISNVTWSTSGNMTVNSGQGGTSAQIQATGNGAAWVEASISGGPCNNVTIVIRKDLWVGPPGGINVQGSNFSVGFPSNICRGQEYCMVSTATAASGFSYSGWPTNQSYLVTTTTSVSNDRACFATQLTGTYTIRVVAQNACGTSQRDVFIQVNNCFSAYKVYPNPATDKITVEFDETDRAEALPDEVVLLPENSTKPVKTVNIQDVYSRKTFRNGNQIQIDVSDLPRGTYYLHIKNSRRKDKEVDAIRILLE